MSKYLFPIKKLKTKSWIKYWLSKREFNSYVLSQIITGTELYLENSVQKKFKIFNIIGHSEQESTTGKNKLGLVDGTYSDKGITAVVSNGIVKLSGTATNGAAVISIALIDKINSSLGNITKSLNATGTYTGVQTSLRLSDGSSAGLWSNNGANATGELSGDVYKFNVQINDGITVNCILKPQVEQGSTATEFEKYTGRTTFSKSIIRTAR